MVEVSDKAGPRLGKHYGSLLEVASELARTEGPLAFYKALGQVVPNGSVQVLPGSRGWCQMS